MLRRLLYTALLLLALGSTVASAAEKNPLVAMETSMGTIKIELFAKEAPVSVKNFLTYVNSGFYKGTTFHRVIPGFMAQGGGLTSELQPKPGTLPSIKNEADNGLKNDRGTLAMARSGAPDSATSQFFINVVNNERLNYTLPPQGWGYCAFGKVIQGMDVAQKIVAVPTGSVGPHQNVPKDPILIESITLVTK